MNSFPIFIPSKNRYKTPFTINAFEELGVNYTVVIEEQEYEEYKKVVKTGNIVQLPFSNQGLMVARNWIWDYVQNTLKTEYYWTFDDNIKAFWRYTNNRKTKMETPIFLKAIEDFVQRYENVYIGGMQYDYFVAEKSKYKPIKFNHRVYSNMLIKTDIPYRNETFYNDDTDLCLRILKDGNCTVLFYTFLAQKAGTLTIKGGMTDYYKKTNKRMEFARQLQQKHPDITKIVWRYNRWHHEVDYDPYRKNRPIFKKGIKLEDKVNNYGMKVVNK